MATFLQFDWWGTDIAWVIRESHRTPVESPEAAAELQKLRDRLSLAGSIAKVGMWEYDFVQDSLWVSDELAALYGMAAPDLTWPEFASRLHPDDVVAPLERPTPSFPFGHVNEFLFRVRHADGKYRRVRSRSTTYGLGNTPHRKLGAHIDMSEDTLLQFAESNERLRQFSHMAGHDLRAPLRAISGYLSLAIEDYQDEMSPELAELLARASAPVAHMERLITDMLAFATADSDVAQTCETDIGQLLHDIAVSLDAGQIRIIINSSVTDKLLLTASPLSTCVRNLIDNACKHHDKPQGTITASAAADASWLVVDVSDDGPGIPDDAKEKVFQPFYTSDPTKSSGLGLAHVKRTVEKYNGTLKLMSEPGSGTTFSLRWPIEPLPPIHTQGST